MRILVVNYGYDQALTDPEGLLDRYSTLTGWSEALLSQGASAVSVVQIFARDARLRRHGVNYFFCRDGGRSRLKELHRVAADQQPDVVHFNGLIFPWQAWVLRRALPGRTAIVMQDHGGAEPSGHPYRWLKQRAGLAAADAFLFSSLDLAQPWRQAGLILERQIVHAVMESSTAMRPLAQSEARKTSGLAGSPALLWVGRLNDNKDPLTVLDGFERALPKLPGAHLTAVYNSAASLPQVQARIAASAVLRARVHLRGPVAHAELAAFYSAADLFVLGSHREGSGYALIEALACGAVPIVTDIPSFRSLTANGSIGALWPAGSPSAFASALARCAGMDFIASRPAVLEHFEKELSWPVIGRRAMAAYADVLKRRLEFDG